MKSISILRIRRYQPSLSFYPKKPNGGTYNPGEEPAEVDKKFYFDQIKKNETKIRQSGLKTAIKLAALAKLREQIPLINEEYRAYFSSLEQALQGQ